MLIIIIGLPASGKTTYYHNNYSQDFKLYDDFISSFYDGLLLEDLSNGINLCITDPRLCNFERFEEYMKVFLGIIDKSQIELVLFENNKDCCLINADKRNKKVAKTIEFYSNNYDLNKFRDYNHKVIDVFK